MQYFESRRIKPKEVASPTEANANFNDFEDPLELMENDQNFLKEATSFCPTCGSHSSIKSQLTTINM